MLRGGAPTLGRRSIRRRGGITLFVVNTHEFVLAGAQRAKVSQIP
jgi:hypothetical protein